MQQQIDIQEVFQVTTREAIQRMKLPIDSWRATALRRFGEASFPRFSKWLVDVDREIGQAGISKAAQRSLSHMGQTTTVINAAALPQSGPLLILANHPGAVDFVHLFAASPRDDVQVVAGTDAMEMLPNGKQHFLYTSRTSQRRRRGETTQAIVDRLREGGCVLMFPRGVIEPDPRWMPGARQTLMQWRRSMERIAASVPDLTTVPTAISGALSLRALSHWSVRFNGNQMLRSRGAAILQTGSSLINPSKWRTDVTVHFGQPQIQAEQLYDRVSAEMNRLYTLVRDPVWPITDRVQGWL